jgi:hypothetical protein
MTRFDRCSHETDVAIGLATTTDRWRIGSSNERSHWIVPANQSVSWLLLWSTDRNGLMLRVVDFARLKQIYTATEIEGQRV